MSELEKWQPVAGGAVRPGWACGNPKCGTVRKDANHWFCGQLLIGNTLLIRPWEPLQWPQVDGDEDRKIGVVARFALCGEQCAAIAQSIYMAEVVANALQKKSEPAATLRG